MEVTCQGRAQWREIFIERINPKEERYYWLSGEKVAGTEVPDSDETAILEQKISVTPLKFDLTDIPSVKTLKKYGFRYEPEVILDSV